MDCLRCSRRRSPSEPPICKLKCAVPLTPDFNRYILHSIVNFMNERALFGLFPFYNSLRLDIKIIVMLWRAEVLALTKGRKLKGSDLRLQTCPARHQRHLREQRNISYFRILFYCVQNYRRRPHVSAAGFLFFATTEKDKPFGER